MHNVLLGHGADAVCSAVSDLLAWKVLDGDTDERQIEGLAAEFRLWCRAHGIKHPRGMFSYATLGLDVRRRSYPAMHSKVKAAHVRIMIRFVAEKACELCTAAACTPEARQTATMIWALAAFFEVLDESGRWLTHSQQQKALRCGHLYQVCYQQLAAANLQRHRLNYKIRPKQHYFACQLLGQIASFSLNPRYVHCFPDEDFMGCMSRLAKRTSGRNTSTRTMQRWLLHVSQRWEQLRPQTSHCRSAVAR